MAEGTCSVGGCTARTYCRGLCHRHYERLRKTGSTDPAPGSREPPEVSVWLFVQKTDACWLWTGAIGRAGYGNFRSWTAHRFVYELMVGPVPGGLDLDHLCRVRRCVNPEHLEPVTRSENLRRSPLTTAGRTHCPKGHPYDEANTILVRNPTGGPRRRLCRACRDVWNREQRQKARDRKARARP